MRISMADSPSSRRPGFDLGRVGTADKVLAGGAAALFLDCFLAWQRILCTQRVLGVDQCQTANGWQGRATVAGVLMGFLAFMMLIALAGEVMNAALPVAVRLPTLVQALAWATVFFGLVKFFVVLAHHALLGAWIGLAALVVIGYGAGMKYRETQAGPGSGFSDPATSPPAD